MDAKVKEDYNSHYAPCFPHIRVPLSRVQPTTLPDTVFIDNYPHHPFAEFGVPNVVEIARVNRVPEIGFTEDTADLVPYLWMFWIGYNKKLWGRGGRVIRSLAKPRQRFLLELWAFLDPRCPVVPTNKEELFLYSNCPACGGFKMQGVKMLPSVKV